MNAFMLKAEEVARRLDVTLQNGLSDAEIENRRERYGKNEFSRRPPVPFWKRLLSALAEPMMILLLVALFITLGVNIFRAIIGEHTEFIECAGIFIAISLSVGISLIMEGRSRKAFEALNKMKDDFKVRVIRSGKATLIDQSELVPGDVVVLETGNKIPADGRLFEGNGLTVDESALTGESAAVKKDPELLFENEKTALAERRNCVYSGCFVTAGNGKMVVTSIGDDTEFGKIAQELTKNEQETIPIQEKLSRLGKIITVIGASISALVFVIQVVYAGISGAFTSGTAAFQVISEAFISSIVLIVAAVPEGLPTMVAVSLAINVIKMSKKNALVKKLVACETIGCVNVICSDKTGTLTENRMTVTDIFCDGVLIKPETLTAGFFADNICVNSAADLEKTETGTRFVGNPTESALLTAYGKAAGLPEYRTVREQKEKIFVFPFSSETKNMTTLVKDNGKATVYTKGSPEKILSMCTSALVNGKAEPLTEALRKKLDEQIAAFQKQAKRVLGFAHKQTEIPKDCAAERTQIESDLIFDGFSAIADPLRKEVYDAVIQSRSAGVDIKILTGDNIVTASAIADELHLLDADHAAYEAHLLEELDDKALGDLLPRIRVIARSTPTIKMRIVNLLKKQGNVVAVTGDGINDAPAIKNADVGIAMGISGTEVSKEAADIILLDDSFATIVKAIHWGRGIYKNFQRFIQFQLTVNVSSVLVVLISVLAGLKSPFTALQILWINLIMDGPPGLTLGLEPISPDLMKEKPTPRNAFIISTQMLTRILVNGLFITLVVLSQSFEATRFIPAAPEQVPTILFTLFVVFQLFNALNSRDLSARSILFNGLFRNKLLLGMFALTFALQIIITQFGGAVFKTVPLTLTQWGYIAAVGFSIIVFDEIVKLTVRLGRRLRSE